jgi:hypothetical protein
LTEPKASSYPWKDYRNAKKKQTAEEITDELTQENTDLLKNAPALLS